MNPSPDYAMKLLAVILIASCGISSRPAAKPPSADYYIAPMRKVAVSFKGKPGVVLHIGDSITYANPYGQWARAGQGKSAGDLAILKWMHTGANDDSDGWFLARVDRPGGRSDTAASGLRADQLLAGGFRGLSSLSDMLKNHQPQMVVLMIGTNDASSNRSPKAFLSDLTKAVERILANHTICILSTIPPHPSRGELSQTYNQGVRKLAKEKALPLIDFAAEILKRRPKDWNGTLLGKNDVHPSASRNGVKTTSAPTTENLRECGYLLRSWLSVRKIAEVKGKVID